MTHMDEAGEFTNLRMIHRVACSTWARRRQVVQWLPISHAHVVMEVGLDVEAESVLSHRYCCERAGGSLLSCQRHGPLLRLGQPRLDFVSLGVEGGAVTLLHGSLCFMVLSDAPYQVRAACGDLGCKISGALNRCRVFAGGIDDGVVQRQTSISSWKRNHIHLDVTGLILGQGGKQMAANSTEQGIHMSAHCRHGTLKEGPTMSEAKDIASKCSMGLCCGNVGEAVHLCCPCINFRVEVPLDERI